MVAMLYRLAVSDNGLRYSSDISEMVTDAINTKNRYKDVLKRMIRSPVGYVTMTDYLKLPISQISQH